MFLIDRRSCFAAAQKIAMRRDPRLHSRLPTLM
jgi:hypothetical protein